MMVASRQSFDLDEVLRVENNFLRDAYALLGAVTATPIFSRSPEKRKPLGLVDRPQPIAMYLLVFLFLVFRDRQILLELP
jgi:hypothetical protein